MKFRRIPSLVLLWAIVGMGPSPLRATVFLAEATDKTKRDERSRVHYSDTLVQQGRVVYLIKEGKRVKLTQDSIISWAEGFDTTKSLSNIRDVESLRANRTLVEKFAERFPAARDRCFAELKVIDDALGRVAKGEFYKSGKWVTPGANGPEGQLPREGGETVVISGNKYESAVVQIADPRSGIISIRHSGGATSVNAEDLPPKLRKKLGIRESQFEGFWSERNERAEAERKVRETTLLRQKMVKEKTTFSVKILQAVEGGVLAAKKKYYQTFSSYSGSIVFLETKHRELFFDGLTLRVEAYREVDWFYEYVSTIGAGKKVRRFTVLKVTHAGDKNVAKMIGAQYREFQD